VVCFNILFIFGVEELCEMIENQYQISRTMKKKIQIFTLLLIIATVAACRFDEGPMISFRSVENRVAKKFNLIEFTKNNVDVTQRLADSVGDTWLFKNFHDTGGNDNLVTFPNTLFFSYEIAGNKIYIYTPNNQNYDGIEPFIEHITTTWKIERLTKDDFWLSCTYNNSDYYLKLEEDED
jgi:hypothetical protein